MVKGTTQDWRKILRDATGEDLSTRAKVEYYAPPMKWLDEQNKGLPIGRLVGFCFFTRIGRWPVQWR